MRLSRQINNSTISPAIVYRDHAVVSNKPKEEVQDDVAEADHVEVRISSIGKKRNFSHSSISVGSSNNSSNNSLQKPPVNRKNVESSSSLEVGTARKAEEEECYFSSSEEEEEQVEQEVEQEVEHVLEREEQQEQPVKEVRVVMEEERPRLTSPAENLLKMKQKLSSQSQTKLKPSDYVGFSKLPYQVYRRALHRGFHFNLLLVGESGLGKSSLINSMFWGDLLCKDDYDDLVPGVIQSSRVSVEEEEVRLELNILHLPGYGDSIDNTRCWQPIREFINQQFEDYLQHETRLDRRGLTIPDTRIHACLYFISPVGHGLKPLDMEFMRTFQDSVNIIPIIAKADTFTVEEKKLFKNKVRFLICFV